jgi:nucleoside-diphosphate-sugar epimerase
LWGYVDARDVAQACRRALAATDTGSRSYVIAAADTIMDRPSVELAAEVFPDVPVRDLPAAHASLLSSARAQVDLGYAPQYSWRDALGRSTP